MSLREFGSKLPGLTYVDRPGAYALMTDGQGNLGVVQTGFGYFIPGGGVESGEDVLTALEREVFEEIGYKITQADLLGQAAQYHWSEFYNSYFRKIGTFFRVKAVPPAQPANQKDHHLIWLPTEEAARLLTQEFQRWAVQEYG